MINIACVVRCVTDLRIAGSEHVGGSRSFGKAITAYDAMLAIFGIRVARFAAGDRGHAGKVAEERTERRNAAGQDLSEKYSSGKRTQRVNKEKAYTKIQFNVGPENDVVAIGPGFEVLDVVHTDDLNDSDKKAEGEDAHKDVLEDRVVSPEHEADKESLFTTFFLFGNCSLTRTGRGRAMIITSSSNVVPIRSL